LLVFALNVDKPFTSLAESLADMEKHDDVTEETPLVKKDLPRKDTSYLSRASTRHKMSLTKQENVDRTLEEGIFQYYDMEELITWKVFGFVDGTVFQSRTLWIETLWTSVLFWGLFAILYVNRWEHFSEFVGKEATIRAFIAMFSALIGFLLCFYTALNMGRWWNMRMGVHQIQEGCKTLVLLITNGVTQDMDLVETIHRYARASLYLIFQASSCGKHQQPRLMAVENGYLDADEADMLEECHPHMPFVQAQTLWSWLGNAVSQLHDKGFTKGPPHYCQLMAAVEEGRDGIGVIQTHLETPIPMGYVHLLCLMVKFHNFTITVLMGLACVMNATGEHGFQMVGVLRTAFRAFFMPFIYNSILILNAIIIDPFGDDKADFRFGNFDVNMAMCCESFRRASSRIPPCLQLDDVKGIPK